MAIKQGNSDVSAIYLGSTEITKVYRGATEIYSAVVPPVFEPYTVNSWDVENPYYWFEEAQSDDDIEITKIMKFFKV